MGLVALLGITFLVWSGGPGGLHKVKFSKESGFYDENIKVGLSSSGIVIPKATKIRYTMNGDSPSILGKVYENEIELRVPENGYRVYTITAAYCYFGSKCGVSTVGTYVLGKNLDKDVDLSIFSITASQKDLFDYDTGIMTRGKIYDENKVAGKTGYMPGNYNQRTEEWIRDAHVTMIAADGGLEMDEDLGIQISGNTSAEMSVKSIKLIGNKKNGYDKISFDFDGSGGLEGVNEYNSLRLRSGSQDMSSGNIRSAVASRLAQESGFDGYTATKRAVVWLNGAFYGIFDVQQNYSDSFLTKRFNLPDSGDIEKYKSNEDDVFDTAKISSLFKADLNSEKGQEELERVIDMDDYLKYYALNILWNNTDWPQNSLEVWRYVGPSVKRNKYTDGKWRFLIYDTDLIYYTKGNHEYFNGAIGDTFMAIMENKYRGAGSSFRLVMQSEYYRARFIKIVEKLLDAKNGPFRTENVLKIVDEETEKIDTQERINNTAGRYENWKGWIELMKTAVREREDVIKDNMKKYLGVDI